jgi:hypothetical protein
MLLPGIIISTSADDYAPMKQMQLQKFDGTTWKLFGEVISGSGRFEAAFLASWPAAPRPKPFLRVPSCPRVWLPRLLAFGSPRRDPDTQSPCA